MREFKINCRPYGDVAIYEKDKIVLNPGVTVLVGCNGTGKTTLLHAIKESLQESKIPVLFYSNLFEGGEFAASTAFFHDNVSLGATLLTSSEGEQIVANLGTAATKMGRFVRDNKGSSEIWILLDAIDSGLSIDNIIDVKKYLFKTIIDDNAPSDVYIIVSANEYEMCNGENCFDVYTGEYIRFSDYGEYQRFILDSRATKNTRYSI